MRPEIVAEAREWLGTPFVWQASVKHVGCDCKGLIWGVARELGLPEAAALHAKIADYSPKVPVALLKQGLAATLQSVTEMELGDVLLLRIGGHAQHLAFYCGSEIIHTYGKGPKRVIAHSTPVALRAFPLDSVWRFA